MVKKTIITCAVTGNLTSREQHPGLPITPQQIAECVSACKFDPLIGVIGVQY